MHYTRRTSHIRPEKHRSKTHNQAPANHKKCRISFSCTSCKTKIKHVIKINLILKYDTKSFLYHPGHPSTAAHACEEN